MSNKDYPEYMSSSLQTCDKNIIVEELLEKLKAQGCFDAKRKQFLSEITNKSTYQNLHTKVENLATKFLETVRWPPSVQKHQLREQLRLHIQSTDQFNNCVSRLIEQEVNCKIQGELKPMIESKACEYLEVNYEKWKQSMLSQIYENFQVDSPIEKFSHKLDIKKELIHSESKTDVDNDGEVTQSNEVGSVKNIKLENILSQSNIVNSSGCNSTTQSQPKYSGISSHRSPQTIHSNFVAAASPSMPPPIGLLPPPHRILPNNLFQPLPPPPPPMFLPLDRFPPPPPPEDKSLPPPPPPENGPNTPTDEYIPKFYEADNAADSKVKTGLLKTPDKSAATEKTAEARIFSPKKMVWGNIVLPIQDISDDSASDSDKNEHEWRRYSRRSPPLAAGSGTNRDEPTRHFDEWRPKKDSWRSRDSRAHRHTASTAAPSVTVSATTSTAAGSSSLHHCRQKSNDYTDVSSESFTELEFKDVSQSSMGVMATGASTGSAGVGGHNTCGGNGPGGSSSKKQVGGGGSAQNTAGGGPPMSSSSDDDNHSSSSNDHTLNLIRKINKKKTKLRKSRKTPTLVQSSSSYSSTESSSESSSTEHSQRKQMATNYRDTQRGYRVFGRSQSEEKDMDISVDTQSPLTDLKWNSPKTEINLDSMESVQMRKNQIKARLEEIDAKRSLLQKQQMMTTADPGSASNTTSSSSTDSSSDNNTTSTASSGHSAGGPKVRGDKESKKSQDGHQKLLTSPSQHGQVFDNASIFAQSVKKEIMNIEDLDNKVEHDSEPEEGELSSESRSGSMKRDNHRKSPEPTSMNWNNVKLEDNECMSDNNMPTESMKKEIEVVQETMYDEDNIG